jgi:hypothetical protein
MGCSLSSLPPRFVGKRKNVVVFDIDGAICHIIKNSMLLEEGKHDDCLSITDFMDKKHAHYVFKPYIHVLLHYLTERDVRVVFFSHGIEERNILILDDLLSTCYGIEGYFRLRAKGQFKIFSRNHTSSKTRSHTKNLSQVLLNGETLEDVILIEDNPKTVHGRSQKPCILVWDSSGRNQYGLEAFESRTNMQLFAKNGIYFLLGVFIEYFESGHYNNMSLRESIRRIVPINDKHFSSNLFVPVFSTQMELTHKGLKYVRKSIPEALFYGSICDTAHTAQDDSMSLQDTHFHHTDEQVVCILDTIAAVSGEQNQKHRPTMKVFLRSLLCSGDRTDHWQTVCIEKGIFLQCLLLCYEEKMASIKKTKLSVDKIVLKVEQCVAGFGVRKTAKFSVLMYSIV